MVLIAYSSICVETFPFSSTGGLPQRNLRSWGKVLRTIGRLSQELIFAVSRMLAIAMAEELVGWPLRSSIGCSSVNRACSLSADEVVSLRGLPVLSMAVESDFTPFR